MKTLNVNSTKSEEIEMLKQWQQQAGNGSYLSQLLSPNFVAWACEEIQNDCCIDTYDFWLKTENEKCDVERIAKNTIAELSGEIIALSDKISAYDTKLEHVTSTGNYFEKQFENMSKRCSELQDEIDANEINEQRLNQTIIELKSKLYDLMNK